MQEGRRPEFFDQQFEGASETAVCHEEERLSFFQKLTNIWHAARYDFQDGENKRRKMLSCLGFIAFQAIGQSKLPSAVVPIAAVDVLQKTGSPTVSGITAAAVYGTFTYAGLATMNDNITQFPKAFQEVGKSFPGAISKTTKSLPGYELGEEIEDEPLAKKVGAFAVTHAARGLTAYLAAGAYVAASGIDGKPKEERNKLSAKVALDGAALVGLSLLAINQALVFLGKRDPTLAEHVQGYMKNPLVVFGSLGGMVLLQLWRKSGRQKLSVWRENRQLAKQSANQLVMEKQ